MTLFARLVPCLVAGLAVAAPATALDPPPALQAQGVDVAAYPQMSAVVVPPRELTTDAIRPGTF